MCEKTRSKYAPLALFGVAPAFLLPIGLREKVLAATQSIPVPSESSNAHANKSSRGSQRSKHIKLNRNDGFPRLARASRHAMAMIASTTAVLLLIAGVVLLQQNDDTGNATSASPVVVDSTQPITDSVTDSTTISTTSETVQSPTTIATVSSTPATAATATTTATPAVTAPIPIPNTNQPTTSTTPARSIKPVLISTSILDFARRTTASFTLTNNNEGSVNWLLKETSGYFTFAPASGSLTAGASQSVSVTFARASASALAEGEFNFPATATTRGAADAALTLIGVVGRPPEIANFTPTFAGIACSRLNIQVPITDESPIASVNAKITYINSQNLQSAPTVTTPLNDSGKGSWVTSLTNVPATTTRVIVKVTATDIYGFAATSESGANRTNSC
jgi:hypothetical protein